MNSFYLIVKVLEGWGTGWGGCALDIKNANE